MPGLFFFAGRCQIGVKTVEGCPSEQPSTTISSMSSRPYHYILCEPPRNRTWNLLIKSQLLCQLS